MALSVDRGFAPVAVHFHESGTANLRHWHDSASVMRAADIEHLSGIWKGESMQEGGATTLWGETEMTFTRDNNTCRLKGAGTSKWHGQSIEFRLVGTVDPTSLRFEIYKTHIGAFNNTILFKGRMELSPPRLCGNSLKGTVVLERLQNRPSAGQDYYQQNPETGDTVYEHSSRRQKQDRAQEKDGSQMPLYASLPSADSALSPQTMHLRKDTHTFRESVRQKSDKLQQENNNNNNPLTTPPSLVAGAGENAYTKVTYLDVMTPALGIFPERVTPPDRIIPPSMLFSEEEEEVSDALSPTALFSTLSTSSAVPLTAATTTATTTATATTMMNGPTFNASPTLTHAASTLFPLTVEREFSPSRKRPELDSPKEHQQPREKDGYPTCPPEYMEAPRSPCGNPQLYSDHSRDYEPNLRPSPPRITKTGDMTVDASNLCGVWGGASKKKTASHPTGEVTEWNDVVMYFNLKQPHSGTIRGRGESVWRLTVIPFLLEGTFDLEQCTVHLRKIHVGKFNNIVSYDLILGPPEDFLRLSLGGDEGSLELKQMQQVFDRPASRSPFPSPQSGANPLHSNGTASPSQPFHLPSQADLSSSLGRLQSNLSNSVPGGTIYTAMAANSMLPSRPSAFPATPPNPPVYTLLPRTAMIDETPSPESQDPRDVRVASYCLFLSGMLVSDRLSPQQQQALTAYRLNTGITEQEHQAALRLMDLTPKEFEKKLVRERTRSDDMCKVCFERPIDCVLLPCGHLTTCVKCSGKLERCPVCRQGIGETKRVFRS